MTAEMTHNEPEVLRHVKAYIQSLESTFCERRKPYLRRPHGAKCTSYRQDKYNSIENKATAALSG